MARTLLPQGVEELTQEAIRIGLEQGNPNMVKQVDELLRQEDTTAILKDLSFEIVPYTIPDTSLKKIILRCPDYILKEIDEAREERRKRDLLGVKPTDE